MSRPLQDQPNSNVTKRIGDRNEFLFHAGHLVFAACPQLSRFYLSEFQASLRTQDITPAKAIARQLCPQCGQLYVAGLNTTVTLETNRRKSSRRPGECNDGSRKNKKRRRNVLVYECLACHYKSRLPGSEPTIPKATTTTTTLEEMTQSSAATAVAAATSVTAMTPATPATTTPVTRLGTTPPSTPPSRSASSSPGPGNSKKKKKKSNLQAMLASRKNEQGSKPPGSGLGLDDFLSSL